MREIKFRAFVPINGENGYMKTPFTLDELRDEVESYPKGSILMEFTGLKDKKGVEIYEGDIVLSQDEGIHAVRWEQKCAGFMFGDENGFHWLKVDYEKEYEVIGHIYEHEHLLKKEGILE